MSDVVDRVRKLLALAGSPNAHEAAGAAARAQALISRHRLEGLLREPPDPIDDGALEPLEVARRLRRWRVALGAALADANGCVAYTVDLGHEQHLRLAGRPADRAAARALWDWLAEAVTWASATEGAGRDRAWHDAYRLGAVDAIARRLAEGEREARAAAEAAEAAEALVRLDTLARERAEAVRRFATERLGLRPGRAARVDARAFGRGRDAGRRLALRRPPGPSGG